MTTPPSGQGVNPSTTSTAGGSSWIAVIMIAASAFVVGAIVGAYLDWILWIHYHGLMITLAAGAILLVGGIVALIGRGIVRRIALVVLAGGIGLVAGQNLGPSREPLIYQSGGTMTMRLESPVVAVATGPADCTNVASETEFAVGGDAIMRLEELGIQLDNVYLNIGDRWDAVDDAPRKDGVRLDILGTALRIADDGFPSMVVMGATDSSTLESTFSNEGGSIHFANLVAQTRQGFTGKPIDLAGTLEWTCGTVMP